MTRAALITRVVKPVLYFTSLLPLAWIVYALVSGLVMGDEVKFMQHVTGDTILTSLLLTLAVTPLRRLTGWNELIRVRRLIGLTAFWYACLHLSTYLVFDQSLDVGEILADIRKHPWVLVGFAGFLCLVPLAITSTNGWIRRLGGKRWARLHRLVYAAAIAGVLHYWWLVKKDLTYPIFYGVILVLLLLPRLWWAAERARAHPAPARRSPAVDPAG
jgi:methionine sulfoxide reductase heme-binding subunit